MMQPNDSTQSPVEARALLSDGNGNPTPQYKAYLSCQNEYNDKLSAYNAAYEHAKASPLALQRWPIIGKEYSDAVNDAMNKWIVLGHKHDIENALGVLKEHGG